MFENCLDLLMVQVVQQSPKVLCTSRGLYDTGKQFETVFLAFWCSRLVVILVLILLQCVAVEKVSHELDF